MMSVTVVGDFADPLSFLASQRVEQLRSLGLLDPTWAAVEANRMLPVAGRALEDALVAEVRRLANPGEAVPSADLQMPNSRAATAAYAESFADGVSGEMRRALFDAAWVTGRDIGNPDVVRRIVFEVRNPVPPPGDIDWRIRANLPCVPLGDKDPITVSRRLGLTVSMGRGPLTIRGQQRIDEWRALWQRFGSPALPLVITDLGEAYSGERALTWLNVRLPHRNGSAVAVP
jgi:hypothetical protein